MEGGVGGGVGVRGSGRGWEGGGVEGEWEGVGGGVGVRGSGRGWEGGVEGGVGGGGRGEWE